MAKRNETIRIDVEPHIANIDSEVKKYEEKLKKLQKQAQDMGFGDNVVDDIQKCINKLNELKSEYSDDLRKLSNQKIDTDAFDKFSKEVDSRLDEVTENMTNLEETITHLSQTMDKLDGDKIAEQLSKIKRSFGDFRHDTREAVEVLKEFNELVNIKRETKNLNDIDRVISRFSKINLDSKTTKITSDNLKQLKTDLVTSYEKMTDLQDALSKEKNPKAIRNLQSDLVDTISTTEQLAKRIAQLTDGKSIFETSAEFTRNGTPYSVKMIAEDIEEILDANSSLSQSLAKSRSELAEHMEKMGQIAKTKVASFTFEDGGVQIPVVLSKEAMQNCKKELDTLIAQLSKSAEPIDVTLRLFPLKSDASEQKEVSNYIKNIRAQIPELPEGELKDSVSGFMDKFEKEYKKALVLKIKVALSDDVESITKKVNELKQVVKRTKLEISPSFRITEEEEERLKKKINKVKKDFSFDVASELTKMSDSLTTLLSSTNPSAWTNAFAEGLGEVRGKLLAMQSLINPLLDLMNEKPANGTGNAGRPSDETIANRSYVEKFTIAVDTLNKALKAYNKIKSSTKADDFVGDVQKSVDESGAIVKVPIEPVVNGFVEKIQNAIGDVPIDITVNGVTGTGEGGSVVASNNTKPTKTKSGGKGKTTTPSTSTGVTSKTQEQNVSEYEQRLTKSFNGLYNAVVDSIKNLQQGIGNSEKWESIIRANQKVLPELQEITDISKIPSETTREELLTKYLKRKGVDREGKKSLVAQEEELRSLINAKGRKTNKDYENIIKKFVDYEDDGGKLSLKYLASDKSEKMQERLADKYNKLASSIREKNQAEQESVASSSKASQETEKQTQKVEKNTQAKKENKQGTEQFSEESKKLAEEALAKAKAVNKESSAIDENTETKQKNNEAEEGFEKLREKATSLGNLDQRIKSNREQLAVLVDQYKKYLEVEGNTGRPITDLTDNKSAQKKLQDAYEKSTTAVKENTEEKKKNNAVTEQTPKTAEELAKEALAYAKANSEIKENTQAKKENNEVTGKASSVTQANPNDILTDDQFSELYGVNVGSQQTTEKKTGTKKQGITLTDKLKSKIAGQQAKGLIDLEGISDREFNLVIDDIVDGINRKVIDLNEGVEHFKLIINNLKESKKSLTQEEPSFADDIQIAEEQKETSKYIGMSNEELQQCLAKEESWLSRCKEGSAAYEKRKAAIEEIKSLLDGVSSTQTIEKESQAITENTQQVEKNTKAKKENQSTSQSQADYEQQILAEATAREKNAQAAKEEANAVEQSNNTKKFESDYALAGTLKNETNESWDYYDERKGLRDTFISDLKNVKKGSEDAEVIAYNIEKVGREVEESEGFLKEAVINEANYLAQYINQYKQFPEAINQVVDAYTRLRELNLFTDFINDEESPLASNFLAGGLNIEEIIEEARKKGYEVGAATAEGAAEGTAEAQKSKSPSKVAEELGGNWGQGYANGILKSDAKVRAAVRRLVEDGTLTAQQVIDDLPNIKSDKKYKALVSPVEDYKTDYNKAITQVKDRITKLSNAEDLSPEQLDKYDANFNTWINKLKELGVDVTQFQNEYNAVRSKFGASLKESLQEVENQLKKEAEEAEEARKKIWDSFFAEGEKYDQTEETIKTQKTYTELKAAVDEYVKARKRIAQGNPFEHDVENVEKLNDKIIELSEKLNNGKLVDKATSGLTGLEAKIAEIEQQVAQKTQQKLSNTFKGLKGKLESSINDINFEIDKGKHTQKFESELVNIRNELTTIKNINIDAVTQSDIDQAKTLLEQVRLIRKDGKLTENISANKNSIQKNLAQVNSILSGNTKFAFKNTDVYKELVSLQTAFKTFDTSKPQSELAELTTKLLATKAKFEELDNTIKGKNLFQTFIERLHGTTAQLFAMYLSWMDIIRYTRTMINTIKDLDTQLVDLRKTTTMTTTELNEFYYASSNVAKQLGVTTSEIISQAAAWSRLGYSSKEAATEMAQLSSQFTSISPGMTTDNATDYLVSTMQAYGIAVDDVERKIMDNVNRIGNTFATTNAEIGEMLTRSSAAMKAANNSLEETIALEASAVEVTRNAEMTGTAFRTNYCPYVQQCA